MTHTTAHKLTLMQSLLGRNYKWWYIGLFTIKQNFNYFWDEIFTSFYRFVYLVGLITLGTHNNDNPSFVKYLLIGSVFYACTESFIVWQLGEEIKSGKITNVLLKPVNYITYNCVVGLFKCVNVFFSYLPWMAILFFIYKPNLIEDIGNIWVFVLFYLISWFIRMMFDFIFAFGAFWFTEYQGLSYLDYNGASFLSGSLFPLVYLSNNPLLIYNPFAFTFYHPMQIYLGKYDFTQTLMVFARGIAWCIALYFLAKWVFKMGLKRNEAVGL